MREVLLRAPHDILLNQRHVAELRPDEVLVSVQVAGICGSDTAGYEGYSTEVSYPYVPGHEWAGIVAGIGDGVRGVSVGDMVVADPNEACGTCDICEQGMNPALCRNPRLFGFRTEFPGAFAEYIVRRESSLYRLPHGVSFEAGALVEPLSVAYHAIWDVGGGLKSGEQTAIFGAGPIGLLALVAAKEAGARAYCIDPVRKRLELASKLGADEVIDPTTQDVAREISDLTGGKGVRMTVEASGSPSASTTSLQITGTAGTIVLVGLSFGKVIPMELEKVIDKGLTIKGASGTAGGFPHAIAIIAGKKFDIETLITHRFPLESAREAFETSKKKDEAVKVLLNTAEYSK
jgi:L-iditol 2-dehydrogenase